MEVKYSQKKRNFNHSTITTLCLTYWNKYKHKLNVSLEKWHLPEILFSGSSCRARRPYLSITKKWTSGFNTALSTSTESIESWRSM